MPPHAPNLHASAVGVALAMLTALTGCHVLDEMSTDRAVEVARMTCEAGPARILDPVGRWVGCDEGVSQWRDGAWVRAFEGRASAGVAPRGQRVDLIVAMEDGRFAVVSPGGEARFVRAPRVKAPKGGGFYSWRPAGLEGVEDHAVASLHEVDSGRILAVTASNGALISDDEGQSWKAQKWNPRFDFLHGSRPLSMKHLVATENSRLAFLLYPEGEEIATEQFKMMMTLSEAEDTADGGGPVVVTGFVENQRTEVRALPVGLTHHLVAGIGEGANLWVFVGHPERNESTRYQSNDWGKQYMDTGYYDFRILEAVGSTQRVAMLGNDDRGRDIVYIKGRGTPARFGLVTLPEGQTPRMQLAVDDRSKVPEAMAVARGSVAVFYDLEAVSSDRRLMWYAYPIAALSPLVFFLMLRRFLHERRLKKAWDEAQVTGSLGSEVSPEPAEEEPTEPEAEAPEDAGDGG